MMFKVPEFPDTKDVGNWEVCSIGADPELFVLDNKGRVIAPTPDHINYVKELGPADRLGLYCNLNPGSDKVDLSTRGKLSPDGAQLELHPAGTSCRGWLVDDLRHALKGAASLLPVMGGERLAIIPAVQVGPLVRKGFPPSANIFGCDPDWDAYSLSQSTKPMDARTHQWRYGAGHIHIGLKEVHTKAKPSVLEWVPAFICVQDMYTGLLGVSLGLDPELAKRRRKHVGKAGCFRIQPHGIEYRTPDNSWLRHPKLVYIMMGYARSVATLFRVRPKEMGALATRNARHAIEVINENDVPAARKLLEEHIAFAKSLAEARTADEIYYAVGSRSSDMRHAVPSLLSAYDRYVKPEALDREPTKAWNLGETYTSKSASSACHGMFCEQGFDEIMERQEQDLATELLGAKFA